MIISILAAMEAEIAAVEKALEADPCLHLPHLVSFYACGVGKVNAAKAAMIDRNPQLKRGLVILIGTTAALNPEYEVGDVFIASSALQHDVDVTALGFARGEIPYAEHSQWAASPQLVELARSAADKLGLVVHSGRLLTGDRFVADPDEAKFLRDELQGDCLDMEGAAIAHACDGWTDWLVIKVVSDKADHSSPVDFPSLLALAAKRCKQVVWQLIPSLPGADEPPLVLDDEDTCQHGPKLRVLRRED